ncbi:MAG: DUF2974 domain-containing protein [Clostridia bacterium]|nr:DUF2974 domain-containing protein [Clostridia bacterium]
MGYSDEEMRLFSQIAYAQLKEGYDALLKENPGKKVFTIAEVKEAAQKAGVSASQLQSLDCLTPEQMNSWKISAAYDTNNDTGFAACVIETSPGNAAVAFRGSEGMDSLSNVQNDWINGDLRLLNSICTTQQAEVEKFLANNRSLLDGYDSLAMTGHSLGGNLAEYATIVSGKYGLDDNITDCLSLDGPGFSDEFIRAHYDEIQQMCDVMRHARWSFVGTMLNDLPGVDYKYVQVEENDDWNYPIMRHSTEHLIYDENGNLIEGEQDPLSHITSVVSEGFDHLPGPIGDFVVGCVSTLWTGAMWMKEKMFEDGKLTTAGKFIIGALVVTVGIFGIVKVIAVTAYVLLVVAVIAIGALIAVAIFEIVRDIVVAVVTFIAEVVEKIYNWAKDRIAEFVQAFNDFWQGVADWWNRTFNEGYKYANANPQIVINTNKMVEYAQRLSNACKRAKELDWQMNEMYWHLDIEWDAIPRLAALLRAGRLLDYSYNLERCAFAMVKIAGEFDKAEESIKGDLN